MHHHEQNSFKRLVYRAFSVRFLPKHILFSLFLGSLGLVVAIYFLTLTEEVTSQVAVRLQTAALKQREQVTSVGKKQAVPISGWITAGDFARVRKIEEIIEVNLEFDKKVAGGLILNSVAIKQGYAPKYRQERGSYKLLVLDSTGGVLSTTAFTIPDEIHSLPPLGVGKAYKPIKLDRGKFALTVILPTGADSISIVDMRGAEVVRRPLAGLEHKKSTVQFNSIGGEDLKKSKPKSPLEGDNKLDIALISAKYTNLAAFHSDVDRITKFFITNYEPYRTRASQIMFHVADNTRDLRCRLESSYGTDRELVCDNQLVFQALNDMGVPYDKVAVVVNESRYSGTGGRFEGGIAVIYNGEQAPAGFAHELGGHTAASLLDEYPLYSTNGAVDNQLEYNCVRGSTMPASWKNMVGPYDFFMTCGWPNWYRSAMTSIMMTVPNPYFNAVSQKIINETLDFYSGFFSDSSPPSVKITEPTQTNVSGIINLRGDAVDNGGIARVQLIIDGIFILTSYSASPNFTIYTTDFPNIRHKFILRAFDALGNSADGSVELISNNPGRDIGDVDCDLDIDTVDGLFILRQVAGLSIAKTKCVGEGINQIAADVDNNGKIESLDALAVLRYVAGLPNIIVPKYTFPHDLPVQTSESLGMRDLLSDLVRAKYPCMGPKYDANADSDRDKLANIAEIAFGTNPCAGDSDGDGFGDLAELKAETNALKR